MSFKIVKLATFVFFHYYSINMLNQLGDDIWQVSARNSGPNFAILGGVHGNEKTGVQVVGDLIQLFKDKKIDLVCGNLYLIIGNPLAVVENSRFTSGGEDLNRLFCKRKLDGTDQSNYERTRAIELLSILERLDVCIDLHATSKPSVPFLACKASPRHEAVYRWFECDRVLSDPNCLLGGEPVTTDEFVDEQGGVGMCFETGWSEDVSRTGQVMEECLNILRDQGLIKDGKDVHPPTVKKTYFELADKIIFSEGFRFAGFAEGKGSGSFEPIGKGEVIGYVGNKKVCSSIDGVLVFPKPKEQWRVGMPVVFLAKRVK